jgi:hypothetical protein
MTMTCIDIRNNAECRPSNPTLLTDKDEAAVRRRQETLLNYSQGEGPSASTNHLVHLHAFLQYEWKQ